eukprot:1296911-Pleurochrysis_carterae.AAC.2
MHRDNNIYGTVCQPLSRPIRSAPHIRMCRPRGARTRSLCSCQTVTAQPVRCTCTSCDRSGSRATCLLLVRSECSSPSDV